MESASPSITPKQMTQPIAWLFWLLAALFYAYEFTHRVSTSVMIPDLMQSYSISRARVGDLAAFYFYGYAILQLPAGVLVDRYGVRFILTFSCLIVALGSFSLAASHHWVFACFCRFLIGCGSAFAFVGCLKILSNRFAAHLFPLMVGITNLCGILGGILGGKPLAQLLNHVTWRESYLLMGIVGMLLAASLWLVIRDQKQSEQNPPSLKRGVRFVLVSPQGWCIALYAMCIVAPITAFAEMWGVEFFETSYAISKENAAGCLSYIFYGIAVGGPTIGLLGGYVKSVRLWLGFWSLCTFATLSAVIFVFPLDSAHIKLILFVYGFASSHMLLCFSIVNQTFPECAKGAAIGFVNTVVMGGSAIFQPIIGKLIDLSLHAGEQTIYTEVTYQQYQKALVVLPGCIFAAIVLTMFIRHGQKVSIHKNKGDDCE